MKTDTGNETWKGLVRQNMTRAAITLLLAVMTLTAGAAGSPWSHLDVCEGGGGYIHIMGWTYDPDYAYPSLNVNIYVYTDEDCATPYGEMHLVKADEPRPDVFELGWGDHGFDTYIAAEPGTYYVKIIAIDKTDDENALINSPYTKVTVTEPQPITVSLTSETIGVTLHDGDVLTGTSGVHCKVKIADGATVKLHGVDLSAIPNDSEHHWPGITCLGDATIILEGNNVVYGGSECPGIHWPEGKTLTIKGEGSLTALGGQWASGIGCGYVLSCGHLLIEGGSITARGDRIEYRGGAGLGSTSQSSCGSINITGGTVTAIGGNRSAGIGAGNYNSSCGDITISGGIVTATGGENAAGIGGGSSAPNITITEDVTSITATAGANAPHSIGTGSGQSTSGVVTIGGAVIGNLTQSTTIYKPADETIVNEPFRTNGGTGGSMAGQNLYRYRVETIPACGFTREHYDFDRWNTESDGSGTNYTVGQYVLNIDAETLYYAQWTLHNYRITYNLDGGTNPSSNPATYTKESSDITLAYPVRFGYAFDGWTLAGQNDPPTKDVTIPTGSSGDKTYTAHWTPSSIVTLIPETGQCVLDDGHTLTGTGGMNTHVTIADGATVMLSGVTITDIPNDGKHKWAGITCLGDATIILADGTTNTVKGGLHQCPGIYVPEGKTLTIKGNGTLNACSNGFGAGIGCGGNSSWGNILIEGGTITATGGYYAAGIGCGDNSSCGDIVVEGGTVTATGNSYSVGIGCGSNSSCGDITIIGCTVNATGGYHAVGIGCCDNASCGDITFTGCTVTATCGNKAVPIGSGDNGSCGTVTISDGLIDETSGSTRTLIPRIYDLWVNGKQVNACTGLDILGDGTATFDSGTSTLTLDHPAQNLTIRSEDIDLTLKGYYKMDTSSDEVALDVSGGTLTLDGDFTFRGTKAGIRVTDNMSVKGRLQAFGGMDGGICYAGTETGKGMTLERGFFGKTKVELKGTTQTVTHPEGNFYAIWPRSEVTVENPAGGNIQEYTSHINDGQSIATYAVVSLPGTASGDGSAAHPFEIGNGEHWAKACADVANGCETEELYFRLVGGFTATTMMGTADHPFAGTITGDLHSFNVIADINATKGVAALFPYVSGATISDLIVKGSISGGAGSAGIVGQAVGVTTTMENCVFDGTVTATGGEPAGNLIVGDVASGATMAITKCLDVPHHIWAESNTPAYRLYGSGMSLLLTNNTGLMYDGGIWAPAGSTIEFTVIGNMGNVVATDGTLTSLGGYNYSIEMPANNVGIVEANAHPFEFACVNNGVMENGSIRTNRGISGKVAAGTPIYVVAVPNDYCLLEKISVMTVDGNEEIAVDEDHFFSMPASDVTISATFKKKYSFDATNGVLHLLCGDFSGGGSIHSWDPLEVSSAGVTSVIADKGVRFTGLCVGLFQNLTNCTEMDLHNVETSTMTDMRGMFSSCEKLQTLNMTGWNTANVTDMDNMFEACYLLTELDLSMFNTSAVTDFKEMFENCGVYKLTLPAGMAVTTEMELKNGKSYQENNNERRSGWIRLNSDGTVVSGPATETYAAIAASSEPKTYVWQWMPDEFVLELPDNQDNRDLIRTWHGVTTNVKLTGRTLYKDGDWNTICLPFTLSNALDASYPALSGATLMVLNIDGKYNEQGQEYFGGDEQNIADYTYQTSFDETTGTLRLFFQEITFKPGTPILVRWDLENNEYVPYADPVTDPDGYQAWDNASDAARDIVSPTFTNVTITKTMNPAISTDGKVTFVGTYSPINVTEANQYIMLGSKNTLGYAAVNKTLHPFRAHFEVTSDNGSSQPVKGYRLSFGHEEGERGIISIEDGRWKMENVNDAWYDMSGRKLDGKPTKKGLYIHNGRKVAIK